MRIFQRICINASTHLYKCDIFITQNNIDKNNLININYFLDTLKFNVHKNVHGTVI